MDLHNELHYASAIDAQDQTGNTAVVGNIIDMRGFEELEFVFITGTLADAGATWTVLIEEGADSNLSDAAAVADADLKGTEALASWDQADDGAIRKIGYKGNKRYVRATVTPAGNASSGPLAAIAIRRPMARRPAADAGQDGI